MRYLLQTLDGCLAKPDQDYFLYQDMVVTTSKVLGYTLEGEITSKCNNNATLKKM